VTVVECSNWCLIDHSHLSSRAHWQALETINEWTENYINCWSHDGCISPGNNFKGFADSSHKFWELLNDALICIAESLNTAFIVRCILEWVKNMLFINNIAVIIQPLCHDDECSSKLYPMGSVTKGRSCMVGVWLGGSETGLRNESSCWFGLRPRCSTWGFTKKIDYGTQVKWPGFKYYKTCL
jgi:hypothetical protein